MRRNVLRILLTVVIVVAPFGALAFFYPPDGEERGDWLQFIGRFHILVVHLPIALLLMVPIMELLGRVRRWSFLRDAAGFLLFAASASVLITVLFGWLLAYGGGYEGDLVERHMWGGILLAAICWLAFIVRPRGTRYRPRGSGMAYAVSLTAGVFLLGWTSHQGGALTHGRGFLTARMPENLRTVFGIEARVLMAAHEFPDAFYATHVQPIFEAHCALCHGPDKVEGKLRLDSFALMMEGGEYGPAVVPFEPEKSELYRRITLPRNHDEFMPSEGKRPLTDRQVDLLRQWIALGASARETASQLAAKGMDIPVEVVPVVIVRAPDYRPFVRQIRELEGGLGIRLVPVSQTVTDGLILRTVSRPETFDDAALAQLEPLAELIVDAELARTKVSDAGLPTLGRFVNLRKLDLSQTTVTSAGLRALAPLARLEWLNLVGTAVDDEAADTLTRLAALEQVYLFNTQVSADKRSLFEAGASTGAPAPRRDPASQLEQQSAIELNAGS